MDFLKFNFIQKYVTLCNNKTAFQYMYCMHGDIMNLKTTPFGQLLELVAKI